MIKTNKNKRNVVSLPDNFCNVLDNMIDNKMICNRTDALKQIILEQQKTHPDKIIFEPQNKYPAWLSKDVLIEITKILNNPNSINNAMIAINELKTGLLVNSITSKPLCAACGHSEAGHYIDGCAGNNMKCKCLKYKPSVS